MQELFELYNWFMNGLFYQCVWLLRYGAENFGMTYEALNIWVFVVVHPLITLCAIYKWWAWKRAHNLHIQQVRNPRDEHSVHFV